MIWLLATLMLMVSTPAYAQQAGGGGLDLFMLLIILAIFYFIVWRPQMKKQKEHQEMVNKLSRGDKIVTAGGIVGVVSKVTEGNEYIQLKIAEGTEIELIRSSVATILARDVKEKEKAKPAKSTDNKNKKK